MKRLSIIAGIVTIIAVSLIYLLVFLPEQQALEQWNTPADEGEFIVVIRLENGNQNDLLNIRYKVETILPTIQPGNGYWGYSNKRKHGWLSISRNMDESIDLDQIAGQVREFELDHTNIYVIDSEGRIY
jgi:hypothetical protein